MDAGARIVGGWVAYSTRCGVSSGKFGQVVSHDVGGGISWAAVHRSPGGRVYDRPPDSQLECVNIRGDRDRGICCSLMDVSSEST